ncbi:MAG TPA: MarR family transcriptional regulator [Acidimicrobiia bacterium]|nr:MarR family transcriptional regulator [Acidimicrobiia bacterium]
MSTSRALISVAVRSIAAVEDEVTLVQYRALVLLASRGGQNVSELADAVGVHPSTATRLCDRLVTKGLVDRVASSDSRREIKVTVTAAGRNLVRTVTTRRRKEINRILQQLSAPQRKQLRGAFHAFAGAAGELELPDDAWKLGWTS